MITSAAFAGKRYAVLGLARSGLATVEALLASRASVVAWDNSEEARTNLLRSSRAKSSGAGTHSDKHPSTTLGTSELEIQDILELDLTGFDAVVLSPGIPLNRHPIAEKARTANVPIIGDIELFAQARASLPPHKVVGITGTNGKSTTTALIHHILKSAGVPTTMGGNIGLPILAQDALPQGGVYVLELSSYQIDLTYSLDCDVAVLTNITPDHLDRYDGFEAYATSKARLFEMQSQGVAVIVAEDDRTRRLITALCVPAEAGTQPGLPLSQEHKVCRVLSRLVEHQLGSGQKEWPTLKGPHNLQNVAAAKAACEAIGLGREEIVRGLRTYPGLPHRMERVAERGGILFVNDSKATNPTATAPALAAYPLIHWILGGLPKSDDLDDCKPHFDHVKAGYTIGEAGPMFARILKDAGKTVTESGTLDRAVRDAAGAAVAGEVVILSPACASFDQFRDYEARGEAFRAAVEALA